VVRKRGTRCESCGARALPRRSRRHDTVKIGMVLSATGPGADAGKYTPAGTKIARGRVNKAGGVLGKQVELITENDLTTNPGAVLAFSKLVVQPDIVAFLGEIRSTQTHAMAPDIMKTGKPVCFGGTDRKLTKMGNPWLIRFRPNDTYSGRVIAAFGVATLGKKNWAIIHSTDACSGPAESRHFRPRSTSSQSTEIALDLRAPSRHDNALRTTPRGISHTRSCRYAPRSQSARAHRQRGKSRA
jgi:ABC-type branched-subunit amino acid transport system substrate-binding protein